MTTLSDPSVEELRLELERSRAEFASAVAGLRAKVSETTDDFKNRLSPTHLKREAADYVREGSAEFLHSIERHARNNPLQTVAIGAGLAYPLWGLLKAIPVPVLLVAAGLWFSKKSGPSDGAGQDVSGKLVGSGGEVASRVAASVRDAGAAIAAGADTITDKARTAAQDMQATGAGMAKAVVNSVKDNVTNAADSISSAAAKVKDTAADLSDQSRNGFVDLVDRNPLLVAGVGLAIGAFIAASIPPSDAENRVFGERSDDLKGKAFAAASQGVERAKDVAAVMVEDVTASAGRQGLNPDGLSKAVAGMTEGLKTVIDRGLNTALGAENTSPGQTPAQTNFVPSNNS